MGRGRRTTFTHMLDAGQEAGFAAEEVGPMSVRCDLRPYMRGAIFVTSTPWFARTGPDGSFAIEGLPVGTWRWRLWHEERGWVRPLEPAAFDVGPGSEIRLDWTVPTS